MYKLGEQFKINYDNAVANEKSIFQGKKYRITILTDRLVRFEYNDEGVFEDRPTALVWNRKFNVPQFEVKEDSKFLEITTKYFKISYVKEKNYSGGRLNATSNLKVELLNSDRFWYYGHPEVRNLGAPKQQLVNKRVNMNLDELCILQKDLQVLMIVNQKLLVKTVFLLTDRPKLLIPMFLCT